jgi:signal transduction histidine kinase
MARALFAGSASNRTGRLLAAGLLVVGLAATAAAVGLMRDGYRATAARLMDQRTELAQRAVTGEVARYLDGIRLVAAATGGYEPLTRAAYLAATGPLVRMALPGASAVAFVVPATDDRVAAAQRTWRQRGATGLRLSPVGAGGEHLFTVFTRSLDGSPPSTPGLDLLRLPAAAEALLAARRSGEPAVSDTYTLFRDEALPPAARQRSFLLAAPVRTRPDGATEPVAIGWVVLSLRGGNFVGGTLAGLTQGVLAASLWAADSSGRQVQVTALAAGRKPDLHRQVTIAMAQQSWTLRTGAGRDDLAGGTAELLTAGAGGAVTSMLLAGLVLVLATGRTRARAEVVAATAEISRSEQESSRQAVLLTAVVDNLTDGLTVVDTTGRLLVQNAEAGRLLGIPPGTDVPLDRGTGIRLFRPDRSTPLSREELPLVRGMSGESFADLEVFVRTPGRPEGTLLAVSCRPLETDHRRWGAIAVYRDVTVERDRQDALAAANNELAAANNELEAFSYSVSHDLRAPLRRMEGFASLLAEEQGPALPPAARDYLTRIQAAARRMSTLIDDLLAFSQLGRQSLHRRPVQPAEIARAALAQLDGRCSGRDVGVTIADLPACSADPALLEQVYANLLSNAIKFTRHRDPAVIEVGWRLEAGQTVYTVTDNGVGFDPRYADKLFAVFQRLHAGEDYEGTGVGLALVQRIVQRHGGRIWADSPTDRGATFSFTLMDARATVRAVHGTRRADAPAGRTETEDRG